MSRSDRLSAALAVALLLLPCSATPAHAGDDEFVGVGVHATTAFTPDSSQSATFSFGVNVRVRPFRILAIEGAFGVRDEEFGDGTLAAKAYPIDVSALLFLLSGRFEVYALGGVSYMIIDVNDDLYHKSDVRRVPGWNLGGGVQFKVYGPWKVHGDLRYRLAHDDYAGRSLDYDGAEVNVGISYWW